MRSFLISLAFFILAAIPVNSQYGFNIKRTSGETSHQIYCACYSPDGKYLLSGSLDQTVRLWDLARSPVRSIAILAAHTGLVRAVAFSPDGNTLVSGSSDTTIRRYPAKFEDVLNLAQQLVPRELTPLERQALLGEGQ